MKIVSFMYFWSSFITVLDIAEQPSSVLFNFLFSFGVRKRTGVVLEVMVS